MQRAAETQFDAIVVGSGPGGATVARELSGRGLKVLILERGGPAPRKEGLWVAASVFNAIPVSDNLVVGRAFATGGTTALYLAATEPPPLEAFQALGIDLSPDYDAACRELPLGELPDRLLPPQSIRVRESGMALGYPWRRDAMLVDQSKCREGYAHEAKWNAASYVDDAVGRGAKLVNRARVRQVLVDGRRAIGVEYEAKRGRGGQEVLRAYAPRIVLAAGGPATPVILRKSGLKGIADHGFYCHPTFLLYGLASGMPAGDGFAGAEGTIVDGDIHIGDGNFSSTFYRMVMLSNKKWLRLFRRSSSIGVGVLARDSTGGSLSDDGRYYKQLTAEDLRKLEKGEAVARQILEHAGARSIFKSSLTAAHLGGTVRIGTHVDDKLETEYQGLHVCDGSVLPDSVITPTLTLVCLGKYLARRVAG